MLRRRPGTPGGGPWTGGGALLVPDVTGACTLAERLQLCPRSFITRPLRYPKGWPARHHPGERPQEKGIDVALALDFAIMGIRKEYEIGILMSGDTDLKPALEAVADLTARDGTRAEVAAWSAPGQHSRRLAIRSRNLFCHWVGKDMYDQIADATDYSV